MQGRVRHRGGRGWAGDVLRRVIARAAIPFSFVALSLWSTTTQFENVYLNTVHLNTEINF